MKTYLVKAEVEEEVCVADRHSAGNEYQTLDYIPGTVWWGAIAERTGIQPGDPPSEQFRVAFYSDQVIFTNLYPESEGLRSHPVPLSARTSKSAPGFYQTEKPVFRDEKDKRLYPAGVVDWLYDQPEEFEPDREPMRGWYTGDPPACKSVSVQRTLRGHNDRAGRQGVTREGRLFARQNLARGTRFQGALRAVTPEGEAALDWLVQNVLDVTRMELPVGRKPGCIALELSDRGNVPLVWQPPVTGESEIISVTLLSDAILYDPYLRPLRWLPAGEVKEALGRGVEEIEWMAHFSAVRAVFGWNGAYARPREMEIAVVAGSAFCYGVTWSKQMSQVERENCLNIFQQRGIGLRRSEGFGEIRINDPFHTVEWRSASNGDE
jgi:CRISPR-associated protein Csx10